jgi:hypothetical protein
VAGQIFGWSDAEIERRVRAIPDTLARIFGRADAAAQAPNAVADSMARERLARGRAAPAKKAALG